MIIATLSLRLPPRQEVDTLGTLRAFLDATRALPGCLAGGVYEEVGRERAALYIEMWNEAHDLEAHIRSREYGLLLAVMEASPQPPVLSFEFIAETRGLEWVEKLRLSDVTPPMSSRD